MQLVVLWRLPSSAPTEPRPNVAGGRSYMDWLLTVPLLLIELILVMGLDDATTTEVKFTGLTQNLRVDPAV